MILSKSERQQLFVLDNTSNLQQSIIILELRLDNSKEDILPSKRFSKTYKNSTLEKSDQIGKPLQSHNHSLAQGLHTTKHGGKKLFHAVGTLNTFAIFISNLSYDLCQYLYLLLDFIFICFCFLILSQKGGAC